MQDISSLLEALEYSPENVPLRMHVVRLLMEQQSYEDASTHLKEVLRLKPDTAEASIQLGICYYHLGQTSAAIVLLEGFVNEQYPHAMQHYCLAMVKDGSGHQVESTYRRLLVVAPGLAHPELDNLFKVRTEDGDLGDGTDYYESPFIEKSDVNFSNVGGMADVKKQIDLKILKPLQHPELYKAYGKKTGGGILMYGPPGCGKTHIARATAGEMNARFINVSLSRVLSQWQGESEKILHEFFNDARRHTPCVLFIDEIDAIAAKRSDLRNSAGKTLVNQLLAELDGFDQNNEGVLVIGATNVPWHLDPAILRPGRFDRLLFIPPPDRESRESIFKIHLEGKPAKGIKYDKLAKLTDQFSGADIKAVVDAAIEMKLEEAFEKGGTVDMETNDLLAGIKKCKPVSVAEWLKTARNYAVYSNESGFYNEILDYINKK